MTFSFSSTPHVFLPTKESVLIFISLLSLCPFRRIEKCTLLTVSVLELFLLFYRGANASALCYTIVDLGRRRIWKWILYITYITYLRVGLWIEVLG
jgi:hypothetical protein